MVRVTRPGDPVTVGLTRLGQARVLEERPTTVQPTSTSWARGGHKRRLQQNSFCFVGVAGVLPWVVGRGWLVRRGLD